MGIEALIQACKKNDVRAQEQIYKLFGPKMFAVCLKYAKDYDAAQDHFQDGFLIVFAKIKQFDFKGSFEGWMKRIMINNILQHYRNVSPLQLSDYHLPAESEEAEVEDNEVPMEYLLKIVQELPHRYRLVFNLYVIDGYAHKEIAEMLEISTGTSKSNLARARMILREKIENYNTQKYHKPNER